MQPSILRAFGWRFTLVLTKDWYHNPADVLNRIEKLLGGQEVIDEIDDEPEPELAPINPIPPAANSRSAAITSAAESQPLPSPSPPRAAPKQREGGLEER